MFQLQPDKTLEKITEITSHEMPIDNLSLDQEGNIWGAGFPATLDFVSAAASPLKRDSPTTVWRIRKVGEGEYVTEKVVEDRTAKVLGGATVAVHDVKTGRIFAGGKSSLFFVLSSPEKRTSKEKDE